MSLAWLSAMNFTSSVLPFPDTDLVSATMKMQLLGHLRVKSYNLKRKIHEAIFIYKSPPSKQHTRLKLANQFAYKERRTRKLLSSMFLSAILLETRSSNFPALT